MSENRLPEGWKVIQNKPRLVGVVNDKTAKDILQKLLMQNIPSNGVDFPRCVVFKFHGNERTEIYEVRNPEPEIRRITTTDTAKFS